MRLKEHRVNLTICKLLKEKGFQNGGDRYITEYLVNKKDPEYPEGGGPFSMTKGAIEEESGFMINKGDGDFSNKNYIMYEYPTSSLVIDWLIERGFYIQPILVEQFKPETGWGYELTYRNKEGVMVNTDEDKSFETRHLAEEEAIERALNLL